MNHPVITIKRAMLAAALIACAGWMGAVNAAEQSRTSHHSNTEAAIAERIHPFGSVCVEGKECAANQGVAGAQVASAAKSGEEVFKASCFSCHGTGAAGAPKLGDKAAWAPRIAKGMDTLLKSATSGLNAMPPKGLCMTCSDDELKGAVKYMVDGSK